MLEFLRVELEDGPAQIVAVVEHKLWSPTKIDPRNDTAQYFAWERPAPNASTRLPDAPPKAWESLRLWLQKHDDTYVCLSLGDIWYCRPPVKSHCLKDFAATKRLRQLGYYLYRWPVDFVPEPPVESHTSEWWHWQEYLNSFEDIEFIELEPSDIQEMLHSHRYLIFSSWQQVWETTSGCFTNLLAQHLGVTNQPVRCYVELPDFPEQQYLVLRYKDHIKDYGPWHEQGDDYVSGIHLPSEHAAFVRENRDLLCHSREARGWYWETDNRERELWLMDDERSVYNAPLGEEALGGSQIVQAGKTARDGRFQLVMDLVHTVYEWAKTPYRWQFSPHTWYEDGSIRIPSFRLELDLPSLRRSEEYRLGRVLYYYRNTAIREREAVSEGQGCGLRLVVDETQPVITTPAALIREVWRQVFSTRRSWIRNHKRLGNWSRDDERYLRAQTVHRLMGPFLTQEQLHHFRQAILWLCDRFQIAAAERPNIREDWTVAPNRTNDIAERCQRVLAEIELLERQLDMKLTRQQLTVLNRLVQRLRRQAITMLDNWWRTLAQHLDTQDVEVALKILQLRREQKRLHVKQIQDKIGILEDRLRRLADPAYPDFCANLSTAAYIYGQERLTQAMERLSAEVRNSSVPALMERLEDLRREFDFLRTALYNPLQQQAV